jgi:hypothetical protein
MICTFCGALLADPNDHTATKSLGDTDFEEGVPKWGTANFHARMNLVLMVKGAQQSFVFDANEINEGDELVIGRFDPDTTTAPPVDLQEAGAVEKGVSRRHAAILRRDGALNVVDKGSPNGTYLNGQRLVPNQPRILRNGDDIRLGHLVLHVRFERTRG